MNSCNFIGRIGRDAETREAGSSDATSWPLAVDVGFGDKKTTLWLDCTMWGDRGAKIASYIRKGDNIGVSGELGMREYAAKDGTMKTTATLRIVDVKLLAPKQDAAPQQRQQARPVAQPAQRQPSRATAPAGDFQDDDIPF